MNSILIKKLIRSNNETYPETTYTNPLLDKNVTSALSRSFVKILRTCKENTNVNNNIRSSVLENMRKLCVNHLENHVKIEDNFIEVLTKFYEQHIEVTKENDSDKIQKKLDKFLIEKRKDLDLNSIYKLNIRPEIVQSLLNLNSSSIETNTPLQLFYNEVMFWDMNEPYSIIAKDLWANYRLIDPNVLDNLSVKLKPDIENVLLELSHDVLNNQDYVWLDIVTCNKDLEMLINISSISSNCFQMCCSILNYIFISTYYNDCIQRLINEFINHIKSKCGKEHFSVLYSSDLISIVSLLDIEIDDLTPTIRNMYINSTIKNLKDIHSSSENNLIMLLSHFPIWFDLYFK